MFRKKQSEREDKLQERIYSRYDKSTHVINVVVFSFGNLMLSADFNASKITFLIIEVMLLALLYYLSCFRLKKLDFVLKEDSIEFINKNKELFWNDIVELNVNGKGVGLEQMLELTLSRRELKSQNWIKLDIVHESNDARQRIPIFITRYNRDWKEIFLYLEDKCDKKRIPLTYEITNKATYDYLINDSKEDASKIKRKKPKSKFIWVLYFLRAMREDSEAEETD